MSHPKLTLAGPLSWRGADHASELQLGLLSLAAVLQPRGLVPQIVDLNLLGEGACEQEAIAAILDTAPDVVGFGSICSSYPLTLRIAAEVKRLRPSVVIVLGGPQASVVDRDTMLAFPAIDFVVRGEAEHSFPDLLDALGGSTPLSRIAGITYRRGRQIARNVNASVIHDLDELPLPLYDYYPDLDRRSWLPLEAGRGCPFACRFCSTNDFFRRKFRLKSAAKLVAEMVQLSGRYGIFDFQLTHDMFTVDRKRVVAFCDALLEQEVTFQWRCSARTDCVDPDLLTHMARAGCRGIFFGIETGSQRLQHAIDKNLDLHEARAMLQAADRLGIQTTASLITGYPGETLEDLDGTVDFFGSAIGLRDCDPQLHLLSPLAETPLATEYRDHLVYDRIASDISGLRAALHPLDEVMVLAHPDLFPNFYALPCPVDRAYLQHLRAFLLTLSVRAKGLVLALHRECGGLRMVFDAWRASLSGLPPLSDYHSREFFDGILQFIASRYLGAGRTGVEILHRFYSALETEACQTGNAIGTVAGPHVRVAPHMLVVTVAGDVIQTLDALRRAEAPDPAWLDRICVLAVETAAGGRNRILELPPLSASILGCCKQPVAVSTLAARGFTDRLSEAIRVLERQGLLEVIHPSAHSLVESRR